MEQMIGKLANTRARDPVFTYNMEFQTGLNYSLTMRYTKHTHAADTCHG